MWEGQARQQWQHTAALLCQLAQPHRNEEEHPEPFEPWEFNPFCQPDPETEDDEADLEARDRQLDAFARFVCD